MKRFCMHYSPRNQVVRRARGFESHPLRHVGASFISLATSFFKSSCTPFCCASSPTAICSAAVGGFAALRKRRAPLRVLRWVRALGEDPKSIFTVFIQLKNSLFGLSRLVEGLYSQTGNLFFRTTPAVLSCGPDSSSALRVLTPKASALIFARQQDILPLYTASAGPA